MKYAHLTQTWRPDSGTGLYKASLFGGGSLIRFVVAWLCGKLFSGTLLRFLLIADRRCAYGAGGGCALLVVGPVIPSPLLVTRDLKGSLKRQPLTTVYGAAPMCPGEGAAQRAASLEVDPALGQGEGGKAGAERRGPAAKAGRKRPPVGSDQEFDGRPDGSMPDEANLGGSKLSPATAALESKGLTAWCRIN